MSATVPNNFFESRRSFTEIKQEILGQYFNTWCGIRLDTLKGEAKEAMLFIDLHTGAGYSPEQHAETPAKATETLYKSILKRPLLNESVRTFFYDTNKAVLEHVSETMELLPFYEELIHPPVPLNSPDNKAQVADFIAGGSPSLIFLDPFSGRYAQEMLKHALDAGQSDVFMLINPENILKAVAGRKVTQPLAELFGDQLQKISSYCKKEKDNHKRQELILSYFTSSLQEKSHYTQLFKVNRPDIKQPDYYLLFSSPDSKAYRSFKETLLPYTTFQEDGVPLFVANQVVLPQLFLFEQRPEFTITDLLARLRDQAGNYKYKSIEKIYELDSCGTNYSRENYVAAFELLQKEKKVAFLNAKTMQTIRQPTPASVVKYTL
ncbi:hypothetical protein GCM10027443_05210 [Pontibacter brevis]